MGHLRDDIYPMYNRDQSVEILAVSIGEHPTTVQNWLNNNPMPFPVLVDQSYEVYQLFTNSGFPYNVMLDGDYTLHHSTGGFNQSQMIGWIDEILEEAPAAATNWSELRSLY